MAIIILLIIFLIFALLLLFIIGSAFLGFALTRVPFVPTPEADIRQMVAHLQLSDDDVFYELGSGNGRVVFLVEAMSGATVVGYESTLWTHWWARLKKSWSGAQAKLVFGNFFRHSWSDATIIYCYLYPPLMSAVGAKVLAECRPGTRVVSRDFPITNLNVTGRIDTRPGHSLFIYEI